MRFVGMGVSLYISFSLDFLTIWKVGSQLEMKRRKGVLSSGCRSFWQPSLAFICSWERVIISKKEKCRISHYSSLTSHRCITRTVHYIRPQFLQRSIIIIPDNRPSFSLGVMAMAHSTPSHQCLRRNLINTITDTHRSRSRLPSPPSLHNTDPHLARHHGPRTRSQQSPSFRDRVTDHHREPQRDRHPTDRAR